MKYTILKVHPTYVPIDYKKLVPEDFLPDYNSDETVFLKPDANGYIDSALQQSINLQETNTVVINAGVGYGKSTACINIAKQYLEKVDERGSSKYVVVFIAPFLALINQYYIKLQNAGINSDYIFNFLELDNTPIDVASKKRVHIITINTLIGNYGEEAFMQAKLKRNYLNSVIEYCEKEGKKVIFIFDEIHDSISSFKQKFIFNLYNWKYVLHKSFILSATFTESSKIVIKYLADLTNDKIQLLETVREKLDGQSNLHIVFNNEYSFSGQDENIAELIKLEITKRKKVHILTFSETLADNIAKPKKHADSSVTYSKIGQLLIDHYGSINLCTGSTDDIFDQAKCNVGTTFKTGVSLEGDNISLFIIAPQLASYGGRFERYFGIFSDGISSIIQAVARVRKGNNNDIFIITPSPDVLIKNITGTIGVNNYLSKVGKIPDLKRLKYINALSDYSPLDSQYKILSDFYLKTLHIAYYDGIKNHNDYHIHVKSRNVTKPKLDFPTKDEFIISDSDKFLAYSYPIFGSNPAAYIVWAAYNNQFVNCKLDKIFFEDKFTLHEGEILQGLINIYSALYPFPENIEFVSDLEFYKLLYAFVTTTIKVKVKLKGSKKSVSAKTSPLIKKGVISIVQYYKKDNTNFNLLMFPNGRYSSNNEIIKANDAYLDKKTYINSAIYNSTGPLVLNQRSFTNKEKLSVELYGRFYDAINILKNTIIFYDIDGDSYFPSKEVIINNNLLSNDFIIDFLLLLKDIRENDFFLKDNTFSFCRFTQISDYENKILETNFRNNAFGKALDEIRELIYDVKRVSVSRIAIFTSLSGILLNFTKQPYQILNETKFEEYSNFVNLIYKSDCPWYESPKHVDTERFKLNYDEQTIE